MRVPSGAWAPPLRGRTFPLLIAVMITALFIFACTADDQTPEPTTTPVATEPSTPTAPASPTATATETPTASPTVSAGPLAPTDVVLVGRLPDTSATVTPGEGESGRVTIEWSYSGAVDGFRIYQRDCDGAITGEPIEVDATERMFGPLQPCRPGGAIGVAAFDATGESEIVWAVPGEAT